MLKRLVYFYLLSLLHIGRASSVPGHCGRVLCACVIIGKTSLPLLATQGQRPAEHVQGEGILFLCVCVCSPVSWSLLAHVLSLCRGISVCDGTVRRSSLSCKFMIWRKAAVWTATPPALTANQRRWDIRNQPVWC